MTKLIGTMVIYNEQMWLENAIKNLMKITDLHAIEILDGAWIHGGKTEHSNDKSLEIIEKMKKETSIPINFTINLDFWPSEPYKRNWQLKQMEKKYGSDSWVFWFDGDEEIHFHSGLNSIKMEPIVRDKKTCGVVTTYGYGYDIQYPGTRFIPLGKGIHFYSEMANHLHDGSCKSIMNWAIGKQYQPCWYVNNFFIVNRWMVRDGIRFQDKINYFKFQVEQAEKTHDYPPCNWETTFIANQ